jgi:hypothetical protein
MFAGDNDAHWGFAVTKDQIDRFIRNY